MAGLSLTLPVSFSDSSLPKLPIVLASDSFNRANTSSAVLGTTDSAFGGSPVPWEVDANISISGNRWSTSGQSTNRTSRINVSVSNHKVSARWLEGTGSLLARWTDASNYYRLEVQANGLGLYRVFGGVTTPKWGPGPSLVSGDTIGLSVQGSSITIYRNEKAIHTFTDDVSIPDGKLVGLRSAFSAGTIFDDLVVTNS